MKKGFVFILGFIMTLGVCIGAETLFSSQMRGLETISSGKWQPSNTLSKVDGSILVTEVPENKKMAQNVVEYPIDLTPYRGTSITFAIKYRSVGVSQPPEVYNGIKFMMRFSPIPGGVFRWPSDTGLYGTTDGWQWASFGENIPFTATTGTLMLGLQNSSGKVEFDLTTLQVGSLFSAADRVNLDWKVQYPEAIANHHRQRGVMSPEFLKQDDIRTLQEWNANLVRFQIVRNWGRIGTELDLEEYDHWLNGKLDALEQALTWAEGTDIKFVVDLHCLPGGRSSGQNMRMFVEKKYGDHFLKVWQRIATRFKGTPKIYAYNLVNEPLQSIPALPDYDYWNLQRRAAEAIREIDPDTPIMIESNMADKAETYVYLSPLAMHNIIYKVHMYVPGAFTHQRLRGEGTVVTYPGMIDGEQWDKERIRQELQPVLDFQKRHGCKIYVGEFSAIAWAPGAEQYLNDCIELFEEYGWDWTYHAFREWVGWSVEHEGPNGKEMKPAATTPRKEVLLKYFKRNSTSR